MATEQPVLLDQNMDQKSLASDGEADETGDTEDKVTSLDSSMEEKVGPLDGSMEGNLEPADSSIEERGEPQQSSTEERNEPLDNSTEEKALSVDGSVDDQDEMVHDDSTEKVDINLDDFDADDEKPSSDSEASSSEESDYEHASSKQSSSYNLDAQSEQIQFEGAASQHLGEVVPTLASQRLPIDTMPLSGNSSSNEEEVAAILEEERLPSEEEVINMVGDGDRPREDFPSDFDDLSDDGEVVELLEDDSESEILKKLKGKSKSKEKPATDEAEENAVGKETPTEEEKEKPVVEPVHGISESANVSTMETPPQTTSAPDAAQSDAVTDPPKTEVVEKPKETDGGAVSTEKKSKKEKSKKKRKKKLDKGGDDTSKDPDGECKKKKLKKKKQKKESAEDGKDQKEKKQKKLRKKKKKLGSDSGEVGDVEGGGKKKKRKRKERDEDGEDDEERKKKKAFMRKEIRKIKDEDALDQATIDAQKEEQERRQRMMEKIRMQQEKQAEEERLLMEKLEAIKNSQLKSLLEDSGSSDLEQDDAQSNREKLKHQKPDPSEIVTISSSEDDVVMVGSEGEQEEEDDDDDVDDDPNNSGSHVNDELNVPDVNGQVLVNVGHSTEEKDIFLAPQLAQAVKPHQIGGIRFLYDNLVESTECFKESQGFGCILAHSMGLGKTLQVIAFIEVFLRCTEAKKVLVIVPVNTLQNWIHEFDIWLPVDPSKVELKEETPAAKKKAERKSKKKKEPKPKKEPKEKESDMLRNDGREGDMMDSCQKLDCAGPESRRDCLYPPPPYLGHPHPGFMPMPAYPPYPPMNQPMDYKHYGAGKMDMNCQQDLKYDNGPMPPHLYGGGGGGSASGYGGHHMPPYNDAYQNTMGPMPGYMPAGQNTRFPGYMPQAHTTHHWGMMNIPPRPDMGGGYSNYCGMSRPGDMPPAGGFREEFKNFLPYGMMDTGSAMTHTPYMPPVSHTNMTDQTNMMVSRAEDLTMLQHHKPTSEMKDLDLPEPKDLSTKPLTAPELVTKPPCDEKPIDHSGSVAKICMNAEDGTRTSLDVKNQCAPEPMDTSILKSEEQPMFPDFSDLQREAEMPDIRPDLCSMDDMKPKAEGLDPSGDRSMKMDSFSNDCKHNANSSNDIKQDAELSHFRGLEEVNNHNNVVDEHKEVKSGVRVSSESAGAKAMDVTDGTDAKAEKMDVGCNGEETKPSEKDATKEEDGTTGKDDGESKVNGDDKDAANFLDKIDEMLNSDKPPEISYRQFPLHVINDNLKTIIARAKVVDKWHKEGGVLLLGYEMYRLLTSRRVLAYKPKTRKKKSDPDKDKDKEKEEKDKDQDKDKERDKDKDTEKKEGQPEVIDLDEEDKNKEMLSNLQDALVKPGPDLVICDEGHRIKNSHASISQALKNIRTKRRVVLTGYPLQNNLLEYWCMVDFVRPNYLGTKMEFCNMFERPIMNGQCVDSTPGDIKLMRFRAHVLHSLLEGFVQRRGHSVLKKALPPKQEYVLQIKMSDIQRKLYKEFMSVISESSLVAWATNNPLKAFAVCCKIWNHPDILHDVVEERKSADLDNDLDIEDKAALNEGPKAVTRSRAQVKPPGPKPLSCDETAKPSIPPISPKDGIKLEENKPDDGEESHDKLSSLASDEMTKDGSSSVDAEMAKMSVKSEENAEKASDAGDSSIKKEDNEPFTSTDRKDQVITYDWAYELMSSYERGVLENSGKFVILMSIIEEAMAVGDKILVFSQSLFTLNLIEEYLSKTALPGEGITEKWCKNKNYYRLDGSTSGVEREKLINQFNADENDKVHLFLLSTRAGCLGINVVGANRVVVFDASWNPCHDCQAVCRVYRYGQTKQCVVYRLVSDNTMEKKIYDRQINKQGMSDRVVDELNPQCTYTRRQVDSLLQYEDKDLDSINPADIDEEYSEPVLNSVIKKHHQWVTKKPFTHESLLIDRKEEKLTKTEKRLAKQGYEMEKKMNISYSRPSYSGFYSKNNVIGPNMIRPNARYTVSVNRPIASVRPMMSTPIPMRAGLQRGGVGRIGTNQPQAILRPGVSVQQIKTTTDIIIPGTSTSTDSRSNRIPAGENVLVIKTPKGVYIRTNQGKIFAVRTAPKNITQNTASGTGGTSNQLAQGQKGASAAGIMSSILPMKSGGKVALPMSKDGVGGKGRVSMVTTSLLHMASGTVATNKPTIIKGNIKPNNYKIIKVKVGDEEKMLKMPIAPTTVHSVMPMLKPKPAITVVSKKGDDRKKHHPSKITVLSSLPQKILEKAELLKRAKALAAASKQKDDDDDDDHDDQQMEKLEESKKISRSPERGVSDSKEPFGDESEKQSEHNASDSNIEAKVSDAIESQVNSAESSTQESDISNKAPTDTASTQNNSSLKGVDSVPSSDASSDTSSLSEKAMSRSSVANQSESSMPKHDMDDAAPTQHNATHPEESARHHGYPPESSIDVLQRGQTGRVSVDGSMTHQRSPTVAQQNVPSSFTQEHSQQANITSSSHNQSQSLQHQKQQPPPQQQQQQHSLSGMACQMSSSDLGQQNNSLYSAQDVSTHGRLHHGQMMQGLQHSMSAQPSGMTHNSQSMPQNLKPPAYGQSNLNREQDGHDAGHMDMRYKDHIRNAPPSEFGGQAEMSRGMSSTYGSSNGDMAGGYKQSRMMQQNAVTANVTEPAACAEQGSTPSVSYGFGTQQQKAVSDYDSALHPNAPHLDSARTQSQTSYSQGQMSAEKPVPMDTDEMSAAAKAKKSRKLKEMKLSKEKAQKALKDKEKKKSKDQEKPKKETQQAQVAPFRTSFDSKEEGRMQLGSGLEAGQPSSMMSSQNPSFHNMPGFQDIKSRGHEPSSGDSMRRSTSATGHQSPADTLGMLGESLLESIGVLNQDSEGAVQNGVQSGKSFANCGSSVNIGSSRNVSETIPPAHSKHQQQQATVPSAYGEQNYSGYGYPPVPSNPWVTPTSPSLWPPNSANQSKSSAGTSQGGATHTDTGNFTPAPNAHANPPVSNMDSISNSAFTPMNSAVGQNYNLGFPQFPQPHYPYAAPSGYYPTSQGHYPAPGPEAWPGNLHEAPSGYGPYPSSTMPYATMMPPSAHMPFMPQPMMPSVHQSMMAAPSYGYHGSYLPPASAYSQAGLQKDHDSQSAAPSNLTSL